MFILYLKVLQVCLWYVLSFFFYSLKMGNSVIGGRCVDIGDRVVL